MKNDKVKDIKFGQEGKASILAGLSKIAKAISFTIGPSQSTISVARKWGAPAVQANAATVLQGLHVANAFEDMGVSLAKQTCKQQNKTANGGNATSILLMERLCSLIFQHIASGADPIAIKRGMLKASAAITKKIYDLSKPLPKHDIKPIIHGVISSMSGHDDNITTVLLDALELDGFRGMLNIETGTSLSHKINKQQGIKFNRGFLNTSFVNNTDNMTREVLSPKLLILDFKISAIHDILPILQWAAQSQEEIIAIVTDIEPDILATITINNHRGLFKVTPIKSPGFGDRKDVMLENIGAITGTPIIKAYNTSVLKHITDELFGNIDKAIISKDDSIFICNKANKEAIKERISILETKMAAAKHKYDADQIKNDIAQITGGLVSIEVGGHTDMEIQHTRKTLEELAALAKSIIENGFVAGGGVTMLYAADHTHISSDNEDEMAGIGIVKQACQAPFVTITNNGGLNSSLLLDQVRKTNNPRMGIDVTSGTMCDLIDNHILSSPKIESEALISANISAELFCLAEVLIANKQ